MGVASPKQSSLLRTGRALCVAALACTGPAVADAIVINNALHQGVVVKEDATEYVVLVPSDGTILRAPKTHVAPETIAISDEAERRALLAAFNRNQTLRLRQAVQKPREAPKVLSNLPQDRRARNQFDAFTMPDGKVTLTNRPAKYRSGKGPSVFKGKDGVGVLTNLTDKYRNNGDYIEVTLQYEAVHIPERFAKTPALGAPAPIVSNDLMEIVDYYAKYYNLDPALVLAVIRAESNFNPNAVSRAGARGLMQLMPGTAAEMGITEIFDPAQNVAGGTQYLAKMLGLFKNDLTLALAGYNAGPGNVQRYGGVPPFKETQAYVKRVQRFVKLYDGGQVRPTYLASNTLGSASMPQTPADCFVFHLNNALTEAAEGYVEKDEFYILQFEGRLTRIRKSDVQRIQEPA